MNEKIAGGLQDCKVWWVPTVFFWLSGQIKVDMFLLFCGKETIYICWLWGTERKVIWVTVSKRQCRQHSDKLSIYNLWFKNKNLVSDAKTSHWDRVPVKKAGCTHSLWGRHSLPRWQMVWVCHWPCRSARHSLLELEQDCGEGHWSNMEPLKIEGAAEGWRINHWTHWPVGICA